MAAFNSGSFDVGAFDVGAFDIGSQPVTSEICPEGFIGILDGDSIGLVGLLDADSIGFEGVIADLGFIGSIEFPITAIPQGNVTQATLIGGIITLSVSAEPVGLGFIGAIDSNSIGLIGAIDTSDIGFIGEICDC